jgi:hypothetical protein
VVSPLQHWGPDKRFALSGMTRADGSLSSPKAAALILCGMHPQLRIYFDFVWPLFWPWLVWNLLRVAEWHTETGRDALMAVDRFGNIRFVRMSDPPPPDDLYTYEAPRIPRWERPALGSDVVDAVRVQSGIVRHDPLKSGLVMLSHDIVRISPVQNVRGPP